MHAPADLDDLGRISRQRLRLDRPACRAWCTHINALLALSLPPERALAWWNRLHIGLRNQAPIWILPTDWEPDCMQACLLEAYAAQGSKVYRPLSDTLAAQEQANRWSGPRHRARWHLLDTLTRRMS